MECPPVLLMSHRTRSLSACRRPWTALGTGVLLLGLSPLGGGRLAAFTSEQADALFEAHRRAFYVERDGKAWFKESTDGGKVSFWMRAEQMEMVVDAHERTRNPEHRTMFTRLFHGFLADHGTNWSRNPFNDDLLWMVIACARAHRAWGDPEFLAAARMHYDLTYARSASPDLGGGLWWKTDNRSKNACVNGPAAIAAHLLGLSTGEERYRREATNTFLWLRDTLFDPATGRVCDNIATNGRVARVSYSYNQGTFVGAAHLLGYPDEALKAAEFARRELGRDGFLPPGDERGDGGGFNGIALRWIALFARERRTGETLLPWLRANAQAAWQARRPEDLLSWCRWPRATEEGRRYSWGCSSAVVALQCVPPDESTDPGSRP